MGATRLLRFDDLPRITNPPGPVMFIFPPFHRLMDERTQWVPLGIVSLASALAELGVDTIAYNADSSPFDDPRDEHRLSCYERYRAAAHYHRRIEQDDHPAWQELRSVIASVEPWIVGVTVHTENVGAVNKVCRIVKQISPTTVVVCGGPHVTLAGSDSLDLAVVDHLVKGEGEHTMARLVDDLARGKARSTTYEALGWLDLDTLPQPRPELSYQYADSPLLHRKRLIACSRGCPGRCSFCSAPQLWTCEIRRRRLDLVLHEIEDAVSAGASKVFFIDDTFLTSRGYISALCTELAERRYDLTWTCTTRASGLSEELLELMARAGCHSIHLGVESGSERLLKKVSKGITLDMIRRAARQIKNAGIELSLFFMVGFPGETRSDIDQSMALCEELQGDEVLLHPVVPIVGTPLFDEAVRLGMIDPDLDWSTYSRNNLFTSFFADMSPPEAIEAVERFFELTERLTGRRQRLPEAAVLG